MTLCRHGALPRLLTMPGPIARRGKHRHRPCIGWPHRSHERQSRIRFGHIARNALRVLSKSPTAAGTFAVESPDERQKSRRLGQRHYRSHRKRSTVRVVPIRDAANGMTEDLDRRFREQPAPTICWVPGLHQRLHQPLTFRGNRSQLLTESPPKVQSVSRYVRLTQRQPPSNETTRWQTLSKGRQNRGDKI